MTTKLLIMFMFLGVFTCSNNKYYEDKVNLTDAYACEQFEIKSDQYLANKTHSFKVRLLVIGVDTIKSQELENNLKSFGDQFNFKFEIIKTDYDYFCIENTISYIRLLEDNYLPGFLTIIVVCDNIRFDEERNNRIDGAALGVPTFEDPTQGKPILFIRHSLLYSKILHHELGHCYSLSHTFKDYDYENKGLNCETRFGDGINDTVTPLRSGSVGVETCEYYAPEDALKDYSREEILNMVRNPLSYSSPGCMGEFTKAQVQKVRKIVEINSRLQDCLIHGK